MKISVSSYSFTKLYREGKLDLLGAIGLAKKLGFDAIELVDADLSCGDLPFDEYATKLGDEASRLDVEVSCCTFTADFLRGDTAAEVERVRKLCSAAAFTGTKMVRHDAAWSSGSFRSFDAALPTLASAVRSVADFAESVGVRTSVENHGYFCQSSERLERLFNAIHHPNFRILCDIGNFLCVDEEPVSGVSRIAPYASNVHIKDFHFKNYGEDPGRGFIPTISGNMLRGAIVGHGCVPVKRCIDILKRAGYDGHLTIEFEGIEDSEYALQISLENLKRYIGE